MTKQTTNSTPEKKVAKKPAAKKAAVPSAPASGSKKTAASTRAAQAAPVSAKASAVQAATPNKSGGKGLGVTALILSLLALGAGGYAAYQTTLSSQLTTGHVSGMDERVKLVATDQANLKTGVADVEARIKQVDQSVVEQFRQAGARFDAMQKEVEGNAVAINEVREASTQTLDNLKGDLTTRIASWRLDEVRALLAVVGQQFHWTGDPQIALRGLVSADRSLASMNDGALGPVRSALAEEMAMLRAVKPVDAIQAHATLGLLAREINRLPMRQDAVVRQNANREESQPTASGQEGEQGGGASATNWLASTGKALLNDLGSMVTVENIDKTPTPGLNEDGRFMVATSLQLRLQEAQIALLRNDDGIYHSALDAAKDWAAHHYDAESGAVKAWLQELSQLSTLSLQRDLPELGGALAALDRLIQSRQE